MSDTVRFMIGVLVPLIIILIAFIPNQLKKEQRTRDKKKKDNLNNDE